MTTPARNDAWKQTARVKLDMLRMDAGSGIGQLNAAFEVCYAALARQREAARNLERAELHNIMSNGRASTSVHAAEVALADAQTAYELVRQRYHRLTNIPNPTGELAGACESIARAAGVLK